MNIFPFKVNNNLSFDSTEKKPGALVAVDALKTKILPEKTYVVLDHFDVKKIDIDSN